MMWSKFLESFVLDALVQFSVPSMQLPEEKKKESGDNLQIVCCYAANFASYCAYKRKLQYKRERLTALFGGDVKK